MNYNKNKKCHFCSKELNRPNKLFYFAEFDHYIKNFYLKRIKHDFSCIYISKNNWFGCEECAIEYYNWIKLLGKDKINQITNRRVYGGKVKVKVKNINKNIFSEYERCPSCKVQLDIRKDQNVLTRLNYIEGIGTYCSPCYDIIVN